MNSICTSPSCRANAQSAGGFYSSNLARASVKTESSAELSLTTGDGDVVRLSSRSLEQAQYATYNFQGRLPGQTVAAQGAELQLQRSHGYAISVQGELDEEELADIEKVLEAVKSAGKDLAAGDLEGVLSPFENLGELDSLQSFQANLSFSREISAFQASSRAAQGRLPVSEANQEERKVAHEPSLFQRMLEAVEQLDKQGNDRLAKQLKNKFDKLSQRLADRERQLAEQISSELLKRQADRADPTHGQDSL